MSDFSGERHRPKSLRSISAGSQLASTPSRNDTDIREEFEPGMYRRVHHSRDADQFNRALIRRLAKVES